MSIVEKATQKMTGATGEAGLIAEQELYPDAL
jgi:hypothetical protein